MPVFALLGGFIYFAYELLGFRGKFQPLGEERRLSEIWWHFPIIVTALLVLFLFWPCRFDRWDDI
jgi:hypothetical protein